MQILQGFVDRIWYAPLLALLAMLDTLIVIIPTDSIMISSSMLAPRRWLVFAVSVSIGSTVGAVLLAALVEYQGLPWILQLFPSIENTHVWALSAKFLQEYGSLLIFAVGVTPLMQQPILVLAAVANTHLAELAAAAFAGRIIKFCIMTYIGSHAPRLLKKLWGVRGELKDAGVNVD